ncbi:MULTISPECIES: hypothetical protein [unclassified Endozoicomonas]|uniref:hypothetical protein n=1 Tax=unclassified Endozoicomonas TaxID=2644528 RepID=UPI003BB6CA1F
MTEVSEHLEQRVSIWNNKQKEASGMMKVEKYTLKDGETGWLAHIRQKKKSCEPTVVTSRFSCSTYGNLAFQKALEWIENRYYQTANSTSE